MSEVYVYVHSPVPPFEVVSGAILSAGVQRRHGLSAPSAVSFSVASVDVDISWLSPGACWSVRQPEFDGAGFWAGFLLEPTIPKGAGTIPISLAGPKEALLAVEFTSPPLGQSSRANAVRQALEAAQAQGSPMLLGLSDDSGAPLRLEARADTVSGFIDATMDAASGIDWLERSVERELGGGVDFYLDVGKLRSPTDIVLGDHEIIEGVYIRKRGIGRLSAFGGGVTMSARARASVPGDARTSSPRAGVSPATGAQTTLLGLRTVGPASTRDVVEVRERVDDNLRAYAEERFAWLLQGVEEITCSLDMDSAAVQRVALGQVVRISSADWQGQHLEADVHVRRMQFDERSGKKDIVGRLLLPTVEAPT